MTKLAQQHRQRTVLAYLAQEGEARTDQVAGHLREDEGSVRSLLRKLREQGRVRRTIRREARTCFGYHKRVLPIAYWRTA